MRHPLKIASSLGFVLRGFSSAFDACTRLTMADGSRVTVSVRRPSLLQTFMVVAMILLLPLAVLALTAGVLHAMPHSAGLLAFPAVLAVPAEETEPASPAKIRQMRSDIKALAVELEKGQAEIEAGTVTEARGKEIDTKVSEMTALQEQLDRYDHVQRGIKRARGNTRTTLPAEPESKRKRLRTTWGHKFVASDAFAQYKKNGKVNWSGEVEGNSRFGKTIVLTGEEAEAFETKAFSEAQLSVLGDNAIIEIDRDPELVRFEEPEILGIRDILGSAPTTSDTIRYVRQKSVTRAAESQASRGALKPFLKVEFEAKDATVETIAVLSKVTEQDIDDAPRLIAIINSEMTLDVKVVEETQIVWGDGSSGALKGLFHADNALTEFDRSAADDTVVDLIRRMRTDLRKTRIIPTSVAIDPLDWEEVELAKGSDKHYLWGLITDLRGPRIWSMPVVETDAMTNPLTGERRLLIGDGVRGATVYDRNALRLAVGFMDDDFGRNLRTLRAEERLALAVKRPFAFKYAVMEAGS